MTVKELLAQRESMLRAQIEEANERLAEFAEKISEQGTTVIGSRGNLRAHPLLAAERETRREHARFLDELERVLTRLDNERRIEQANAITAWGRRPPSAATSE